jgi:hypothetical protein
VHTNDILRQIYTKNRKRHVHTKRFSFCSLFTFMRGRLHSAIYAPCRIRVHCLHPLATARGSPARSCSTPLRSDSRPWQADAFIPYKCKKGECGTCDVLIDGKWVHACQTTIPSMDQFIVNIRPASITHPFQLHAAFCDESICSV